MLSDSEVNRVLIVTAHPDDVDFGAAGSIARWTDNGIDVRYCIITDGDAGGFDPAVPRSEIPTIRRAEQTAAAKSVGVTELHFLGHPDGRLQTSIELRRDISRVIRQVRPDRVVAQSPDRNFQRIQASHPDHLAAGEATLCAVYPDARNPFAHPELLEEGLEPHTVDEVWLMASAGADHAVDITDTVERKISALRCHVSQLPNPEAIEGLIRRWGEAIALSSGLPDGRLAEAFQVISTV
ncbi:MAG TPA: PIG-L deacetylase family protein [Acidimicrobiales bacterium]|jgi:LmbE family N-acetylglucosaminyl deacetylase|nr:PIG-L deacetylase family protein [Acidimicrobiales bacterium]